MKLRHRSVRIAALAFALSVALPEAGAADRHEAAAAAATGRLTGMVVIGSHLSTRRMQFSLYPDLSRAAVPAATEAPNELANVVVYLEPAAALSMTAGAPSAPRTMRQENLSFAPHLLSILRGSTVDFPNEDPIYHNVFSLSKGATFDLGRYPKGSSKSVSFDEPGVVKVFCHIHADMSAVIMVLDNPFFATPDAEGRFTIPDIPAGEYTVVAWHERARPLHEKIRIEPGRDAAVRFTIPLTEQPDGE